MSQTLNSLPKDLQLRIEALNLHLDVAIPGSPSNCVDGFLPLLEYIKGLGGVFVIKWDGERQTRHYTAVVSHPDMESYRVDDQTIELAIAKAILVFAEAVLDFPDRLP